MAMDAVSIFVLTTLAGLPAPPLSPDSAACGAWRTLAGRRQLSVCPAAGPIRIDGARDDAGWAGATRIELPYEVYPGDNRDARVRTTCWLTFDERHLFLFCEAADPDPGAIRAFFTPRDDVEGQDRIGLMLDPFNDARHAFEFAATPLGVQEDGVYDPQQGSVDVSWDAIWRSAGRVTTTGYSVEIAIPFSSFRFPRGSGTVPWGFFLWRLRPRSQSEETRSVPLDRGNSCLLCQAELAVGLGDAAPGRNLQLTPTLTTSRTDARPSFPTGPLETGAPEVSPGGDVQWNPGSNLTVAATVSPDFSQVEADVAQLDVNNRFTLFFPEKRPFFVEGAEFYSTPMQAVFTRTVADPTFAAKLSAKMGGSAVGAVVARDRVTNLVLPANQGSALAFIDAGVTTAIARLRRDVGTSSTLGLLYTGREAAGYHNRILGLDAFALPWRPLTLRLQILHSRSRYPAAFAAANGQPTASFTGSAALAQVNYDSRTWRGEAYGRLLDPMFRADAGFITQVDVREVNAWVQRQFWGRGGSQWLTRFNLTGGFWDTRRVDGSLTERVFWGNVLYLGPGMLRVFLDYQRRRELYADAYYSLDDYRAEVGIAPSGAVQLALEARAGDAIDLDNARPADWLLLRASATLRLGRHLDLGLSDAFERLSSSGASSVASHLPQLRAVYNLDAHTLLRAILQYRATGRDTAAYAVPVAADEQHLFLQLLLAYEPSPQTVLFVGYADDRDGLTDPSGRTPLTMRSRTFFVKLGYAWRP
jgi:hypothetical protein